MICVTRSFFLQHWAGLLPLPRSFWQAGVPLAFLPVGAAGWQIAFDDWLAGAPERILFALGAAWIAGLAAVVWWVTGVWRSASAARLAAKNARNSTIWSHLAKLVSAAVLVFFAMVFWIQSAPAIGELVAIVVYDDPEVPQYRLSVLESGTEIELLGGIRFGLSSALRSALERNPGVKTLHLTSPGGRVVVADRVRKVVRDFGLDTYVSGTCASACTSIFLAGKNRYLDPKSGQLGFHGLRFPGMSAADEERATDSWARDLGFDGLAPGFIYKALTVPAQSMWFPDPIELVMGGIVTDFSYRGQFSQSRLSDEIQAEAHGTEIVHQLRGLGLDPLLNILKLHYPSQHIAYAALLVDASDRGDGADQILASLVAQTHSLMRMLASDTAAIPTPRQESFIANYAGFIEQVHGLSGAAACGSVLSRGLESMPASEIRSHAAAYFRLATEMVLAGAETGSPSGVAYDPTGSDWRSLEVEIARIGGAADILERLGNGLAMPDDEVCDAWRLVVQAVGKLETRTRERLQPHLVRALAGL